MDKLPEFPAAPLPNERLDQFAIRTSAYWEAVARLAVDALKVSSGCPTCPLCAERGKVAISAIGPLPAPRTDAVQK